MIAGLERIRELWGGGGSKRRPLSARELPKLREQLRECAAARGGEVSARNRAARLGETYLRLDDDGRRSFLRMIALEFGPDPKRVAEAHAAWQKDAGTPRQWDAEARLRAAMRSSRIRILTQFNALPQGVKFLVDMRADLQRYLDDAPELKALDRELEARLTAWFDVGFLELQRINWNSPAALLEKLIAYEAVHEIRSWADLKNRLDSDRRCYAFFHPRMPTEPLIFVEVALTDGLADNVQALLDENAPVFDAERAGTAIFYSISTTQPGLRGVSFGNFLLKRVIDDLQRDLPKLKLFATLSPMPRLAHWLRTDPAALALSPSEKAAIARTGAPAEPAALAGFLATGEWADDAAQARALREPLLRAAARYLAEAKQGDRPYDGVARFHLGNGARIERINWLADRSPRGMQQSFGLMVNYLYDPDRLEDNVEAYVGEGMIAASAAVRRLCKG